MEDEFAKRQRIGGGVDMRGGGGMAIKPLSPNAPPPAEGTTRLYRVEPTVTAKPPDWVQQGLQDSGIAQARGRWFTDKPQYLDFYKRDIGPNNRSVYVDVPNKAVEQFRATNQPPAVRNFSLEPESEFFMPPRTKK